VREGRVSLHTKLKLLQNSWRQTLVCIQQLFLLVKRKSRLLFCTKPWRTAKTPKTLKGVMSSRDATKRDFFAFKSEAKRWSQSDNRPSTSSTSAGSATCMSAQRSFRNLHMYLYMYMLYLVCDLTEVFFIVSKRSFIPENCLFLRSAFCCLVLQPAFRCLTCLDLA